MMQLHMTENRNEDCKHLRTVEIAPKAFPPIFTPVEHNHTCLVRSYTTGWLPTKFLTIGVSLLFMLANGQLLHYSLMHE